MLVHAPRHLVAASVANVLLLERLVPDHGVAVERAAEGEVERHHVVDLVRERADLGVVHLVRVGLLRPLALLGMPKLVEDGGAAQPSQLPVVDKASCERREIPVIAPEPVAAKPPLPVREGVGYLQVVEPHDKVATDVLGDVRDQQQPRPLRAL